MNCDLQGFLLRSLSQIDECATEFVRDKIELLWSLSSWHACGCLGGGDVIRYWVTRRQVLLYLIGCYANKYSVAQRIANSRGHSEVEAKQDSHAQGASASQSSRKQDSVDTARYDDQSRDQSTSGSESNQDSGSQADSSTKYDDTGSGKGHSERHAKRNATTFYDMTGQSHTKSDTDSKSKGYGCRLDYGWGWTKSQVSFFASKAWSKQASSHFHRNYSESESDTIVAPGSNFSTSTGHGESHMFGDRSSLDWRYFHANIEQHDRSSSAANAEGRGHAESDSESNASGFGFSLGNARSKTQSSSRSDAERHGEGSNVRTANKFGTTSYTDQKLGQISKHLRELYANADGMVKMLSMNQSIACNMRSVLLTCSRDDGYCPLEPWRMRVPVLCAPAKSVCHA
jgi:hypothetical protein